MDKKEQKNLEALRERLYSRGDGPKKRKPYELKDDPVVVRKSWRAQTKQPAPAPVEKLPVDTPEEPQATTNMPNRKRRYRLKLVILGLGFFVASIVASSLFILWGGNSISGENIAISINGPFTLGGGETLPLQIGVTNQNSVPIESATLLVEYPLGTQSTSEPGKELFSERLPLSNISAGETVNIPLQAQVFGEENEEQTIRASVEYRVEGSNATFYKEAEPLRFKISSSPVVLKVESTRNLSVGQETEIEVTVTSNSPNTLTDLLLRAEYPVNFEFSESNPSTASGQNIWNIRELEPEESVTVTIKGEFFGSESEAHAMNFTVGVPNERDQFNLASVFASASSDFVLSSPAVDVVISVDGSKISTASVEPDINTNLSVEISNTHTETLYDVVVTMELGGNAMTGTTVKTGTGYYDSNTNSIIWDVSKLPKLGTFRPADSQVLNFSVKPGVGSVLTPQIRLQATVNARRESTSQLSEEIGTATADLRVESSTNLSTVTTRSAADFGTTPPEVGETTSYTIQFEINNGSNTVANTTVTATLPSYVTWLDNTGGAGSWDYNPATRAIVWSVGELGSTAEAIGSFQVSILPSSSQVGTTPTLVNEQQLRAVDKFTGSDVQTRNDAVTTKVDSSSGDGRVVSN